MDDQEDYFDDITKSRLLAGWWILPGAVISAAVIFGVVWWIV